MQTTKQKPTGEVFCQLNPSEHATCYIYRLIECSLIYAFSIRPDYLDEERRQVRWAVAKVQSHAGQALLQPICDRWEILCHLEHTHSLLVFGTIDNWLICCCCCGRAGLVCSGWSVGRWARAVLRVGREGRKLVVCAEPPCGCPCVDVNTKASNDQAEEQPIKFSIELTLSFRGGFRSGR